MQFTWWWNYGDTAFKSVWLKSPPIMWTASGYCFWWLQILCKWLRAALALAFALALIPDGMYTALITTAENSQGKVEWSVSDGQVLQFWGAVAVAVLSLLSVRQLLFM